MRWKRLARLTEEEYLHAVEHGNREALTRRRPEPIPQITMMRTEFIKDERGNLHQQPIFLALFAVGSLPNTHSALDHHRRDARKHGLGRRG
jgi:hypothetical protein